MFGPWIEIFAWLRSLLPRDLSSLKFWKFRISFSFIMVHYMYLVGMTILGSVILYGAKNLDYIDSLFFASGAATQSGLNTVDVNTLYLYQQITLMFIASMCNPIFINLFVVLVRLYWFEKRFQNVVIEARKWRSTGTRERSRTKSEAKREEEDLENGVGDRKITVMRQNDDQRQDAENKKSELPSGSTTSVDSSDKVNDMPLARDFGDENHVFPRQITFADEVRPTKTRESDVDDRMPTQRSTEHHIAFVEKQRKAHDEEEVLYIPGPRDFEKGHVPEKVREEPVGDLQRTRSNDTFPRAKRTKSTEDDELNGDDHPNRPNLQEGWSRAKNNLFDRIRPSRSERDSRSTARKEEGNDDDADANSFRRRGRSNTLHTFLTSGRDDGDQMDMPYLSYQPTVGRNSTFINLDEAQREELGGIEYRALKTLAFVLIIYYVGFHIFGLVSLLPWILHSSYQSLLRSDGINPGWWGVFTPASMFNDLGYTLTPDSMISFNTAVWPLIVGSFLIIIGNTGFPCMLRFVIWVTSLFVRTGSGLWEELRFLLDHPRRCFTLLFPGAATWWLFWVLVALNGIDLVLFIVLDLNDPTVTSLAPGIRVLNGWFQAASTRTAGFSVVNLAELHPAIQVSYLIMMYISVFPVAISIRRTNVYEEQSLGVYGGGEAGDQEAQGTRSFMASHLRRQLSFDLWYVFLGLFIIAIAEGNRLQNTNEYAFTLFSVLFEIVSAYGTVGLSLGYPNLNASFSAEFTVISKLVIIAMQIRGRHRGLPYALDKAILLPSEQLHAKEAEEADRVPQRADNATTERTQSRGVDDDAPTRTRSKTETLESANTKGKRMGGSQLSRFISGALSAGPTIPRKVD